MWKKNTPALRILALTGLTGTVLSLLYLSVTPTETTMEEKEISSPSTASDDVAALAPQTPGQGQTIRLSPKSHDPAPKQATTAGSSNTPSTTDTRQDSMTGFYAQYPAIKRFLSLKQVIIPSESQAFKEQALLASEAVLPELQAAYQVLRGQYASDETLVKKHMIRTALSDLLKDKEGTYRDGALDIVKSMMHDTPDEPQQRQGLATARNEVLSLWRMIKDNLTDSEKGYLELELAENQWNGIEDSEDGLNEGRTR